MSSIWSQDLFNRAWQFAAAAHLGQTVTGGALPYLVHIGSVTMEIMAAMSLEPPEHPDLAVQCAILHDTLEDTEIQFAQLSKAFGNAVALGVSALTKNAAIPDKTDQMKDSLSRIVQQPREIWMVKLADRISNLQPPPPHWPETKIRIYHAESELIHRMLHPAHRTLAERLSRKIAEYGRYY